MKEKLSSYAKINCVEESTCVYWKPTRDVESVLRNLKPDNDICESILGFNDSFNYRSAKN